jgi:hypothetical protein
VWAVVVVPAAAAMMDVDEEEEEEEGDAADFFGVVVAFHHSHPLGDTQTEQDWNIKHVSRERKDHLYSVVDSTTCWR